MSLAARVEVDWPAACLSLCVGCIDGILVSLLSDTVCGMQSGGVQDATHCPTRRRGWTTTPQNQGIHSNKQSIDPSHQSPNQKPDSIDVCSMQSVDRMGAACVCIWSKGRPPSGKIQCCAADDDSNN